MARDAQAGDATQPRLRELFGVALVLGPGTWLATRGPSQGGSFATHLLASNYS